MAMRRGKTAKRRTASAKKRSTKRAAAKPTSARSQSKRQSRSPEKARKTAPRKKADPRAALAAMARKIVQVTVSPSDPMAHLALYAADATSTEATMDVARGLEDIAEKARGWEQMQEGVDWTARGVWLDPAKGTICIEWDGRVKLRGGPTVSMREVAIHEVKNGKIVAERYYYNPAALAPAQT